MTSTSSFDSSGPPQRFFELAIGTRVGDELRVASFRGTERMTRPFAFEIVAAVKSTLATETWVGQPARLSIGTLSARPRTVWGVIGWSQIEGALLHDRTALRFGLVPRLALLKRRKGSRIFQDASAVDIVDAVLKEGGVARRWQLRNTYPTRSYCVQYQETDFAFVMRLLAEEGIFYWFEHPAAEAGAPTDRSSEVMVIADEAEHYALIDGDPALVYRETGNAAEVGSREHHVTSFLARQATRPRSVRLRDYDFRRPLLDLSMIAEATDTPADGGGRVYEHHGEYDEPDVDRDTANTRLEQHRRGAAMGRGVSRCRRLLPGARFRLNEHDLSELDSEYVVTRVDHEGRSPEVATADRQMYENRFECVSATARFRPRPPRRKVVQVVETAVVVGPEGSEIHTDEHGRIKVQFHWDLQGRRDDRSSCWMRVSQAWAGTGWGFHFIPRVGMEVLVTFLGGDVDRPIVTGCVYNAMNPPTHPLPQQKTKSGIRTRSTPGGDGFNEIAFEDSKGHEVLSFRAQRDLTEHVLRDHTVNVSHDESIHVAGEQHQSVGGNQTQNVLKDQKLTVAGSKTDAIAHDRSEVVGGRHTEEIKGDRRVTVRGNDTRTMDGSVSETIEKDHVVHVNGYHSVAVGLGAEKSKGSFYVRGDYFLGAAGVIKASADHGLILQCGESSIEITPKGIKISAPTLKLSGSESTELAGKGPRLSLGEDAELVAKKLRILTPKASLVLDGDAKLKGKRVMLNCDDVDDPGKKADDVPPEETRSFKLAVKDPELEPYAGKRYALLVDGKVYEGQTSGSGEVEQKLPVKADRADLTVWIDDWPTGRQLAWHFELGELPEASSLKGVQARLKNLGYHEHTPSGELDDATGLALRWFQRDHALPETGAADEATSAAVVKAHGH